MSIAIINILIDISRKAASFLPRDFGELEFLQSSSKSGSTKHFVLKSYEKTKERILKGFEKYGKESIGQIIFLQDKTTEKLADGKYLLINLVDNLYHLERSLPFFSMELSIIKVDNGIKHTICCVVYFPILGELYFASLGGGAWVEKLNDSSKVKSSRLRINARSILSAPSKFLTALEIENFANISNLSINNLKVPFSYFRTYGSIAYATTLLCNSKIDYLIYDRSVKNTNSLEAVELLVTESGGIITNLDHGISIFHDNSLKQVSL